MEGGKGSQNAGFETHPTHPLSPFKKGLKPLLRSLPPTPPPSLFSDGGREGGGGRERREGNQLKPPVERKRPTLAIPSWAIRDRRGFTRQRTPNVHISEPWHCKHHQHFTRRPPERKKKYKNVAGEGKREILNNIVDFSCFTDLTPSISSMPATTHLTHPHCLALRSSM